ncbi:MAG: PIN/TRAM domain-containing protein [Phycisphaerae bacterium]|nr:PIN/TRAM domain-containing protein [Phycisphaerae bacterium]
MSDPTPAPESEPGVPEDMPAPSTARSNGETQEGSRNLLLLVVRLLFLVLLVSISMLTIAGRSGDASFRLQTFIGVFLASASIGTIVIVLDAMTPNKRLSSVVGVYLGVCFGLIAAIAVGFLLDVVAQALAGADGRDAVGSVYLGVTKAVLALVLCYLSVSVVLTTKDDFRLVIPYVEFARQVRGVRPLLIDTSVLIDGRIDSVGQAGFVDAPILITTFVLEELQRLADSQDRQKRIRGRRGLDMVSKLQENPYLDVAIEDTKPDGVGVDAMLVQLALDQEFRILTNDQNLRRVAEINGLPVLNLNELAGALRSSAVPGDRLEIEIVKPGESSGQGVGYLDDGTMVVVDGGGAHVGSVVTSQVTNALQTNAGRMIFARTADAPARNDPEEDSGDSLRSAATRQPRATGPGPRADGDRPPRGGRPRRG